MTTMTYNSRHGLKLLSTELGAWMNTIDAITDLTPNTKDLVENGTLTKSVVATGAPSMQYSGFSAANYLHRAYDSDFDLLGSPATDGHTLMGWVNVGAVSTINTIIDRQDIGGIGARYNLRISSDGTLRSTVSDGTNTHICDSEADLTDRGWIFVAAVWDGVDTQAIYINGELSVFNDTGSAVGSLVNGTAVFRIGLSATGTDPCAQGLTLCRVAPSFMSAAEILAAYNSEKEMFAPDAPYLTYNEETTVIFPASVMNRENTAVRKVSNSIGGNRQVIFNREDVNWEITTSEIQNDTMIKIQLMLTSLFRGDTLQLDPYDTGLLISCILDSNSYVAERIDTSDYFMITFNVRQL